MRATQEWDSIMMHLKRELLLRMLHRATLYFHSKRDDPLMALVL